MIRINLLPYRAARTKENIRIQVNIFLGSLVILCGLIYLGNVYLQSRVNGLKSEIASTREQVAKYQQINQEIAEIKKKLDVLTRKIDVINNLERDRKAPVRNLDEIYRLVVEKRMWYTQLEERGSSIKISGIAIDNQTVADYMTRVEKSENFTNIRLAAIKQQKIQDSNLNLKQFDVNFEKKTINPSAAKGSTP
jgi:type IV pilus assembly protein PilN